MVPGIVWLGAAVIAAVPIFWFGYERLVEEWMRPEFRFKMLVPVVSLVLFLQVLRSVPTDLEADRSRWLGVLMVAGSILLAVGGNLVEIDDFVFLAIIPWICGIILTVFGMRWGVRFWPVLALLMLMLPLPRFLIAPIQRYLEEISSNIALETLRVLGVPVLIEGQLIDFGVVNFRISDISSALLNFVPLIILFCVFFTLYRGALWSKIVLLLFIAPMLVLLTAFRIVLLGIVINRYGAVAAEGVLYWTGDWIIFGLTALISLGLFIGLEKVFGTRNFPEGRLDFDVSTMLAQAARVFGTRPTPQLIAAAIITLVISTLFMVATVRSDADFAQRAGPIHREPFRIFPPEIAGWQGSTGTIDSGTAGVLDADDFLLMDFFHREEPATVELWSAYYATTGATRGQIHSPEECLPGDGWNIVSFARVELPVGLRGDETMTVNRAIISRGSDRALVYYWFEGRGRTIANERVAKLASKVDGLITGRTDGAIVRLVTPIQVGEDESLADARLLRLMDPVLEQLPRFIPE
jgi:exosortase D (VPLPA-CTERM-specific)